MKPTSKKRFLIFVHFGFLLVGIITVLLGQILPILSKQLSLSDTEAGYFFIAQFSGSLLGVFLYNRGIKNFGFLKTLFAGFCLMAAGCLALNADGFLTSFSAILIYGTGIGLTIPTTNMLIAELDPSRSTANLSFLNFFWGAGAIASKPYVDFVGTVDSFFIPTVILSAALFLVGVVICFSQNVTAGKIHESPAVTDRSPIWKTPTAWLIAFFNFIQIGIESSVGGWITTFELRMAFVSPQKWLSAALIFFLFMVIGRGIAPMIVPFLTENALLMINLLMMTAGVIVIFLSSEFFVLILGAGILGLGTSSVFPTNMSRFTKIFGPESTRRATPVFVFGSIGGASMTWLVGYLSTAFGDLRSGFIAILIGCLILIFLQFLIARRSGRYYR
ncbi:MAG: hypothetical protein R2681_04515 [Pyrinomonadaceae bacterium]